VTTSFQRLRQALRTGADVDRLADVHETLAEALSRLGYRTGAFTGGATLDPRIGFEQGFASYDTSMAKLDESRLRALVQWVSGDAKRPFFLFWHTFEVHAPYLHDDFVDEVLPRERAARVSRTIADLQKSAGGALPDPSLLSRKLAAQKLLSTEVCASLYDGGVRSMDVWIGRFLDELKRAGLYDRTLIVLTSDHGEQLGEEAGAGGNPARDGRSYNIHGHTLYEEMTHIPLILKLPGQAQAGRRVAALSRAIDVMPTVLDLLGSSDPEGRMQGRSLRPLWERPGVEAREAFSEALARQEESKSLRTDRYKYVLSFSPARGDRGTIPGAPARTELYDLKADPEERTNLLSPRKPEIESLAARLDAELRRVAALRRGTAAKGRLDPEALSQLKALGYIE
jgi:arylsulfatase A-like enzyme